jgi:hypothetical protein
VGAAADDRLVGALPAVSPRLALTIGAIAAFGFGIALTVFPAAMLASGGLAVSSEAIALSREIGVTLIGLGVIDWLARDATGQPLRALLVGNLVVQALAIFVNLYGIAAGQLPIQAASALLIHLALGAVFVLAMRSRLS